MSGFSFFASLRSKVRRTFFYIPTLEIFFPSHRADEEKDQSLYLPREMEVEYMITVRTMDMQTAFLQLLSLESTGMEAFLATPRGVQQ